MAYKLPKTTPFYAGGSPRGASFRRVILQGCPFKLAMAWYAPKTIAYPQGEPKVADPLDIGIQTHEALEARFRRLDGERGIPHPETLLKRDEARNAYRQTMQALPDWVLSSHIVGVESSGVVWVDDDANVLFRPPEDAAERLELARRRPPEPFVAGPYPHTHRPDLVVQLPNKKVRVIDWKTAWTVGFRAKQDKARGFDGNLQFTGLDAWGRRTFGKDYDGVWVILAPKAKYKRARVGVLDVTPTSIARRRFGHTVVYSETLFRAIYKRYRKLPWDRWPAVLAEQGPCRDRYGECEFYAPCRGVFDAEETR